MSDRLTRWEGRDEDGPRAVLVKHDGPFAPILQEVLRKLARFEDEEERREKENEGRRSMIGATEDGGAECLRK